MSNVSSAPEPESNDRLRVTVRTDDLRTLLDRVMVAIGCPSDVGETVATVFFEADLRAIHHQGLDYVPKFVEAVLSGKIDPAARPVVVRDAPAAVLIDGKRGPGQLAAMEAVKIATERARRIGSCTVGITNSSDFYMPGYFAEQIARSGCIGMVFSDSPPHAHPFGGIEKIIGTNPVALAVPTEGSDPFLIDMALTTWARSSVREASYRHEQIPEGIAIDDKGHPTRDPQHALAGAMTLMAGYKGYALALFVALMSGPLVGAATGRGLLGWQDANARRAGAKGHLMIAIDPSHFRNPLDFGHDVSSYLEDVRGSRRLSDQEIRIPGQRTFIARAQALASGVVAVDSITWANSNVMAERLGVAMPAVL